ncbi:MAG TPA: phenylalanine--tRNA ligase subunit alpha [Eubacteriaceae bacterium]|nr:phenylalanine--tRNA ligase subunit alpha [Eubacteriaceae bacterium]
MKKQLEKIKSIADKELTQVKSINELEELRIKFLGKKGQLTKVLRGMGQLTIEERPVIGKLANKVRSEIEKNIQEQKEKLETQIKNLRLSKEEIDITLPGKKISIGNKHPLTLVLDEIKEIFLGLGFSTIEGPEVELSYYNFDALNVPQNHPSKDLQDTFYFNDELLLRTQTSPMQIRAMEKHKPPIRFIVPGKVYRVDEIDATHSPVFHQIEGLLVDKDIAMSDLKGTLEIFAKRLFGENTKTRFRPHQFYFTEPSAEMDVSCFVCNGKGCRVCQDEGWIEILGCGMVHPNVLEICHIDSKVYSGFAFGMGLDRITMIKYDIDDLRLMFENDIRFLKQF